MQRFQRAYSGRIGGDMQFQRSLLFADRNRSAHDVHRNTGSGLQTSADILIYGNTKDGRILHIVKMLESMPNDDLEFIENNILLVCNWLNQKSK